MDSCIPRSHWLRASYIKTNSPSSCTQTPWCQLWYNQERWFLGVTIVGTFCVTIIRALVSSAFTNATDVQPIMRTVTISIILFRDREHQCIECGTLNRALTAYRTVHGEATELNTTCIQSMTKLTKCDKWFISIVDCKSISCRIAFFRWSGFESETSFHGTKSRPCCNAESVPF